MTSLEVWIDDATLGGSARVGQLSKATSRTGDTISFEYDTDWLAEGRSVRGFPLDHELYFNAGRQFAKAGAGELSGAFQDASPDRWGKRLMDRREVIEAREQGRPTRNLRAWDYLIGVHDESRMGALRLRDPASGRHVDDRMLSAPPVTELARLEAIAAQVERGDADLSDEMIRWIKQIVAPGASLGGARPKAGFRDATGQLWLAKFPSNEDRMDVGLWEYLTWQLSLDAGIEMPEARLLLLSERGHTFAVRRFDRSGESRRMFSSAMTRLDATESDGHSYLDLVQAIESTGTSTHIARDLEQLFRRALFNVLIGNRDDHLRNHGFLREGDGWRLSPAFDVNPNPYMDQHVLAFDDWNTSPDSSLLLDTAEYYRLSKTSLNKVVTQVRAAVRGWEERARALGASAGEMAQMQTVIDANR